MHPKPTQRQSRHQPSLASVKGSSLTCHYKPRHLSQQCQRTHTPASLSLLTHGPQTMRSSLHSGSTMSSSKCATARAVVNEEEDSAVITDSAPKVTPLSKHTLKCSRARLVVHALNGSVETAQAILQWDEEHLAVLTPVLQRAVIFIAHAYTLYNTPPLTAFCRPLRRRKGHCTS